MNIPRVREFIRFGKIIALVAGLIGFVSSAIGIYSFIRPSVDQQQSKMYTELSSQLDIIKHSLKENEVMLSAIGKN